MSTKEITGEQISAFADGESTDAKVELALAALRQAEGKADWEIYHQIGDLLRSDDMAISMSPGFAARMAARLDAEPTICAPMAAGGQDVVAGRAARQLDARTSRSVKRWALPGMAAAVAAAVAAFVATPQLMVALKSAPPAGDMQTAVAVAGHDLPAKNTVSSDGEQGVVVAASVPGGVVLRDSRIDDYLLAHQRFSPSVFSTAQYARSATFETDSNK